MRLVLLIALAVCFTPAALADPINERPLCEGEPVVELERCYDGYRLFTCGSDDRLMGAGCIVL